MLVPDLEHIIPILIDGFWFILAFFGIATLVTSDGGDAKLIFGLPLYFGGFIYVICNFFIDFGRLVSSIISFVFGFLLFFALKKYFSRNAKTNK